MIESIELDLEVLNKIPDNFGIGRNCHKFLLETSLFKKNNFKIDFKKGINIISASNGSGKSSLMNMLAVSLACFQGGTSSYTDHWINNEVEKYIALQGFTSELRDLGLIDNRSERTLVPILKIKHDAQSAYYCDPRKERGLLFNGRDFDHDFFEHFKEEGNVKSSTGNKNQLRMKEILAILKSDINLSDINSKIPENYNSFAKEKVLEIEDIIKPKIQTSAKTLLIDEVENALDFDRERELFSLLKNNQHRDDLQIIIITHSPLAFKLEEANFITDDIEKLKKQQEIVLSGNYFNLN